MRIAIVDDLSLYSRHLVDGFKELGVRCTLYGPITPPRTKTREIMENLGPSCEKVWTTSRLPFQVFNRAARDRPNILHIQFEFLGIHSYGPLYASAGVPVALFLLRLLRVKSAVTMHSVFPRGSQLRIVRDSSPTSKRIPILLLEAFLIMSYRLISILSSAVVVHAEVFKKRLVEHYHVSPSKVEVIPHGAEPAASTVPLPAASEFRPGFILYFGVISPRKGLETLLSAFGLLVKQRNDCELWLAGSSPPYYHAYESVIRNMSLELGADSKVRFLGTVDGLTAHKLFEMAKFIVLPYSYDVSASGALSWALGHGLPAIVSDTPYFREEMSQVPFGVLVSLSTPQILADAMEALLTHDQLRASFSKNAKAFAAMRSWLIVAKTTLEFYRHLLGQR